MIWTLAFLASASAEEIILAPGGETSIQSVINDAMPGDIITLTEGTYEEKLSTESDGTEEAPITLRSAEDEEVVITHPGEVFQIENEYWIIEGITFDGQYGNNDIIEIRDSANHTRLNNVEVKQSGRDCIDMDGPTGVRISNSTIHHCLYFDADNDVRDEAHGITGGAVQDLRIENTDIHTFSGDGIQFDSNRSAPGWNNIYIEGCRFWLEPLTDDTAGFSAGDVPGDNAIETRTWNTAPEANLTIVNTKAWGFKDGMDVSNQAAFLFKEHVNVKLQRIQVHDSEIAFRLRGPTSSRPKGATVHMENTLIHDVEIGVRYEDDLVNLSMAHITFGSGIDAMFEEADSERTEFDIRNSLFLIDEMPEQVDGSSHNQTAANDDFVDVDTQDHHLIETSNAVDAGVVISGIGTDLDGNARIVGLAPDIGAYEYGDFITQDTAVPDTGGENDSADADDGDVEDEDTAEPDNTERSAGGLGAAEQVGEKGGCGCHASRGHQTKVFWGLLGAFTMLFRRRKFSNTQSIT